MPINKSVNFRISILKGGVFGSTVLQETHSVATNEFGLVNLEIGNGHNITGSISSVDWGTDLYFLKVEMDPAGGSAFIQLGISQLLGVPYALHAKTVEKDQVNDADADPTNEIQSIQLSGAQLTLTKGGGTVTLPSTGDNWGSQSVVTNLTMEGNGTAALPLKLASQRAMVGSVLKWDGTNWTPGTDLTGTGNPTGPAGGDLSGTYPDPLIGNGKVTSAKIAGGVGEYVCITGVFTGLSAGSHTLSMWVIGAGGSGTNGGLDPGCWSDDHVIVREVR